MFAPYAIAEKHYAASIFLYARIAHDHRDDVHRQSRDHVARALRGL
jgi:hypothetical protein